MRGLDLTIRKLEILKTSTEQYIRVLHGISQTGRDSLNRVNEELRRLVRTTSDISDRLEGDIGDIGDRLRDLDRNIGGATSKLDKMQGLGKKMSVGFTTPLVGGMVALSATSSELSNDLAKLYTNAEQYGVGIDTAMEAMSAMSAVNDEFDSNVEGISNLLASGLDDNQLLEAVDALSGAAIKFKDTLKFEGLADGLQETLATSSATGTFAEMLERLGYNLDDFNEGLAQAQAEAKGTDYVMKVLAETGLSETTAAFKESNEELVKSNQATYKMQEALSKLGDVIRPIITTVVEFVTKAIEMFTSLDTGTQKFILVITGLVAVIGPILVGISTLITALPALGAAFVFATGPIGLVIAAISALAVGIIYLWNTSDKFRDFMTNLFEGLKKVVVTSIEVVTSIFKTNFEFWGGLINSFVQIFKIRFTEAINFWKNIISTMASVFENTFKRNIDFWNGFVNIISKSLGELPNIAKSIVSKMIGVFSVFGDKVKNMFNGVVTMASNMVSKIGGMFDGINAKKNKAVSDVNVSVNTRGTVNSTVKRSMGATSVKSIPGFKNGGSISGGQLFIANEGGNAELIGNIDGTGRTNVANNKMITDSIYEAVYNAISEVEQQKSSRGNVGTVGTVGETKINISGFGLIDSTTLKRLARELSPYMSTNRNNICDTGFSI